GAKVGADPAEPAKKIDFTKLLGFQTVNDPASKGVDFQDETIAAKLGAKVGIDVTEPARSSVVMRRGSTFTEHPVEIAETWSSVVVDARGGRAAARQPIRRR